MIKYAKIDIKKTKYALEKKTYEICKNVQI